MYHYSTSVLRGGGAGGGKVLTLGFDLEFDFECEIVKVYNTVLTLGFDFQGDSQGGYKMLRAVLVRCNRPQ